MPTKTERALSIRLCDECVDEVGWEGLDCYEDVRVRTCDYCGNVYCGVRIFRLPQPARWWTWWLGWCGWAMFALFAIWHELGGKS